MALAVAAVERWPARNAQSLPLAGSAAAWRVDPDKEVGQRGAERQEPAALCRAPDTALSTRGICPPES